MLAVARRCFWGGVGRGLWSGAVRRWLSGVQVSPLQFSFLLLFL